MPEFRYDVQDGLPAECAVVDKGLDDFNHRAAPLHEVQSLSCLVRDEGGAVVGGAIGRRWGELCELQQLWVEESHRGKGLGAGLVQAFERHACQRGCKSFYLETLSFQAPVFYKKLGYKTAFERTGYPYGIVKYYMHKEASGVGAAALQLPPDL